MLNLNWNKIHQKLALGPAFVGLKKNLHKAKSKTKSNLKLSCTRAQASIEYVLLLIIVVTVILSVVYRFNSSFSNFAQNYFGNYLICLLEAGELPGLGGTVAEGISVCDEEFQAFTLLGGRPPKDPSEVERARSERAERERQSNKLAAEKAKAAKDAAEKNENNAVGSSSASASGPGSTNPRQTKKSARRAAPNTAKSRASNSDKSSSGSDKFRDNYSGSAARENFYNTSGRPRYIELGEYDESEDSSSAPLRGVSMERTQSLRPKLVPYNEVKKREPSAEEETDMSFPDFLRYLIIAGIIVALVLFLGGQLSSISKSLKK